MARDLMAISRQKFVVFALGSIALVLMLAGTLTLAADLVLHARAERSAGLNRWGYRGPVQPVKQAGEVRLAMLGGSTAFGYGVRWHESIPALVAERLNQQHPERKWTALNLGYNTEGAYAFLPNLQDFAYLEYDVVLLYEGYNDLLGDLEPNRVTVRQQSPVFRSTGYFPILPLWLRERSLMLRSGGSVEQGYDKNRGAEQKTVFRANLAQRASASALEAAATVGGALERQLERAAPITQARSADSDLGCAAPWGSYCQAQHRAIEYALSQGKRVLVVGQPELVAQSPRQRHEQQQQALAGMVSRHYGTKRGVTYFAVGTQVDLADSNLSFDQMHLNPVGNRIVAEALVDPVYQLSRPQLLERVGDGDGDATMGRRPTAVVKP